MTDYLFLPTMRANIAHYVDMLESLRRGAQVVYDGVGAMLLREHSDTYILGAIDMEEGRRALDMLPPRARMLVLRDDALRRYAAEAKGFVNNSYCAQVYYAGPQPMPSWGVLDIHHPSEADWDDVRASYDLIEEEALRSHFLSDDFFCGYCEGKLAAFAGLHSEGAMGMLYVFPSFRRRGFAEEMSAFMVNRQRALGRYAYAHIFWDNEASLALQRKTGMTFADCSIWWMWQNNPNAEE